VPGGEVRVYAVSANFELSPVGPPATQAAAELVAFHPNRPSLAVASAEGSITIWDVTTGQTIQVLYGRVAPVRSVCFDSSGRRLAVAGGDELQVWDLALSYVRISVPVPGAYQLAFNGDGTRLATVDSSNTVHVYDTRFPTLAPDVEAWAAHSNYSLPSAEFDKRRAFSPDGRLVAEAMPDEVIRLVDARTGEVLHEFDGEEKALCIDISPDGRYACSGSYDRESAMGDVRLWNLRTGQEIRRFYGHTHYAWDVTFSPDSQRLLTGGRGTMHLWDVHTGEQIRRFPVRIMTTHRVTISPDGRIGIASCDVRPGVYWSCVFDLETGEELLYLEGGTPDLALAPRNIIADTSFGTVE
jgi:WD40 repeat protein